MDEKRAGTNLPPTVKNREPVPQVISDDELPFTGERVIPGKVDADLYNEHFARYVYARQFCAGKKILDTGCGTGYGSRHLAEAAQCVVGIDNDRAAIAYAKSKFSASNTQYFVADCQCLPFADGTFDVVTSFELIEHLPDARAHLAEVRRVLRPGGVLVVSTPNHDVYAEHRGGELNPFHVQEWNFAQFASLLKEHFKEVEFLGENHVASVAILSQEPGEPIPTALQGEIPPKSSDYFVCVCSQQRFQCHPGIVLVPNSGNVLLERERHVRILEREVNRLQGEFEEKAKWADNLNADLTRARSDYVCLDKEHDRLRLEAAEKASQNKRLSSEVEVLAAMWRKQTRLKRLLTFAILSPLDWLVFLCLSTAEVFGRLLHVIAPIKRPEFPRSKRECSFIIVSWNGKDLLAESIPALLKAIAHDGGKHEVIVVDNGSVDGTSEFIQQNFPQIILVRNEQNLYFSGGNRVGIDKASHDILVLLNNDMIVDADFLGPLLEPFADPDVFGVGSQVFLPAGKPRQETGKTRATFNGGDLDWKHEPISPYDEQREYVPVFWLHGGAAAIDRRKYLWLGGLDAIYDPFYVEDADLSYRAWRTGWKCLLSVKSHVLHKHRSSTQRFGESFIRQIVRRNQYLFFWKNFGNIKLLLKSFLRGPRLRARRAGMVGVGIKNEIQAYIGAAKRLPAVLRAKVVLARSATRTEAQIFALLDDLDPMAITSSDVNFALGSFDSQVRGEWHIREEDGGRPYRWIGQTASVLLRSPGRHVSAVLEGYVPELSSYQRLPVSLVVKGCNQKMVFQLAEGKFSHSIEVPGVAEGDVVGLDLHVSQTFSTDRDQRRLGIILYRVALVENGSASSSGRDSLYRFSLQGSARPETSIPGDSAKRLLMICAYLPCIGVHGGGTVMYHLIRHLSRRYQITILSFFETDSELEMAPLLAPFCERLEAVRRGQSLNTPNRLGLIPPEIAYEFYSQKMQALVNEILRGRAFDVVDCQYLQTGHFLDQHSEIPAVLTHHEVYSLSLANQGKTLRRLGPRLRNFIKWARMLNYEEKMLCRFSSVIVFTEAEKQYLNRYIPKVSVRDHATGVDCDFFSSRCDTSEGNSLMFLGNFRHSPNVTGIQWFVEKVWPSIRARHAQAKLYVVGTAPTAAIRSWHGENNIVVTGQVPDVRPYFENCTLCIAPLWEGAGLRGKILEAWAMEKPVIGTSLAFLGLQVQDLPAELVANDAASFATSVCRLLEDPQLRRSIGLQARQLATERYSWDAFAAFYDAIYREAMRAKSRQPVAESDSMDLQLHSRRSGSQ